MRTLVYLCGPPGAGKSTLMAALTAGIDRHPTAEPVPHDCLAGGLAAELGVRREGGFPGTDGLSMSIQPKAIAWIAGKPYPLILGEGQRLANKGFLYAAMGAGYTVTLVHLDAAQAVLDGRCAARGSRQSPAWRRGAATRARKLADAMELDAEVIRLDAVGFPDQLAAHLTKVVPGLADFAAAARTGD